jgi:arsenical pump membrane protein
MELALGLMLVLVCLAAAVLRPLGASEAVIAIPCVCVGLITGATSWSATVSSTRLLAPTIAFLAAILVFGQLCANVGVSAISAASSRIAVVAVRSGCWFWSSLALGLPQLLRRETTLRRVVGSAGLGFCLFVFALAALVSGVLSHGVERGLRHILPTGSGLIPVIALALLAAVLANLVNNLPATLALAPVVAHLPLAVLAVLIGVNVGPNATFPGSLATLLWRRNLPPEQRPSAAQFYRLGLLTTPVIVVMVTVVLWLVAGPLQLR